MKLASSWQPHPLPRSPSNRVILRREKRRWERAGWDKTSANLFKRLKCEWVRGDSHSFMTKARQLISVYMCGNFEFFFVSFLSSKSTPHPGESDICFQAKLWGWSVLWWQSAWAPYIVSSSCFCTQARSSREMQPFSLQIRQEVSLC